MKSLNLLTRIAGAVAMLCGALLLAVSGRAQSTVQVPVPERQGTVVWGELHAGLVVPVDKSRSVRRESGASSGSEPISAA